MKNFSVMILIFSVLIPFVEVRARAVSGSVECVKGDAKLERNNRGYELLTCDKTFKSPTGEDLMRFFNHFSRDANFKSRVKKVAGITFNEALQNVSGDRRRRYALFSEDKNDMQYLAEKYRSFAMKSVPILIQKLPQIIQQNNQIIIHADEKYNNRDCPTSFRGQFAVIRVEFKDGEVMYILPMLLKSVGKSRYELSYYQIRYTMSQPNKRELHIPQSGDIKWISPEGKPYLIDRNKGFSEVFDVVKVGHGYFGQTRDMSACQLKQYLKTLNN